MKNNDNMNNDKTCNCKNKKYEGPQQSYSYYSRLLNKPFDTVEELTEAEAAHYAEQKAKEDKSAQKKADAKKVDDAFKMLNAARRAYKEKMTKLTEKYSADLRDLRTAFEKDKIAISTELSELFNEVLVASVDKDKVFDFCGACSHKTCNNHCCTCAKVICLDGCTLELFNTLNNGKLTVNLDISAHSVKLFGVTETV